MESKIKSKYRHSTKNFSKEKIVASFSWEGERIYPKVYPLGQDRGLTRGNK